MMRAARRVSLLLAVTPEPDGWSFEGMADLGRLVNNGHPAPSEASPRIARAKPALGPRQS